MIQYLAIGKSYWVKVLVFLYLYYTYRPSNHVLKYKVNIAIGAENITFYQQKYHILKSNLDARM